MRGRKPKVTPITPITHNWVITSYRNACFRFMTDFSEKEPLFALHDLIETVCNNGKHNANTSLYALKGDDRANYVFKEVYNKYLKKGALFSNDATGSKRLIEENGVKRWYVNHYLAKVACMYIEHKGDTNAIRANAYGLRKTLEVEGLEKVIKTQFQVILEAQLSAQNVHHIML